MDHRPNHESSNFGLAPMEGVSDLPFRLWASMASQPYLCSTPFLRVTETFPKKSIPRAYAPELNELQACVNYKLRPQLMASKTDDFIRIAEQVLEHSDHVDLNCGCPSPNAVGSSAGSSLLANVDGFRQFVETLCHALGPQKVSVKMRTGFNSHEEFEVLIDSIADLPIKHLSIHGRTRDQRYDGLNRWNMIFEAADRLPYPVLGSGDIFSSRHITPIRKHIQKLDSILVGRGALRNPWIFSELKTGKQVTISKETLRLSLACLGLLYVLSLRSEDQLFALIKEGHFVESCMDEEDQWRKLYHALCVASFKKLTPISELEVPHFVIGRVKMIWNYMRSSLPEEFFEPKILRSKSLSILLSSIKDVSEKREISVGHQEMYDWVYTSRKKQPHECDHLYT